jgi:hypothetical protein
LELINTIRLIGEGVLSTAPVRAINFGRRLKHQEFAALSMQAYISSDCDSREAGESRPAIDSETDLWVQFLSEDINIGKIECPLAAHLVSAKRLRILPEIS